jgi:WD40 repeat protein
MAAKKPMFLFQFFLFSLILLATGCKKDMSLTLVTSQKGVASSADTAHQKTKTQPPVLKKKKNTRQNIKLPPIQLSQYNLIPVGHHKDSVWALDCYGSLIASGSRDGSIHLQDRQWHAHEGAVWSLAFSPEGRFLASVGDDGYLRIWGTDSGNKISGVKAHKGRIWSVDWSADNRFLVTAGRDKYIRVWDARDFHRLKSFSKSFNPRCARISPDGRFLVIAGWKPDKVMLLEVEKYKKLWEENFRVWSVNGMDFSPDGNLLALSCGKRIVLLDVGSGEKVMTLAGHQDNIDVVRFNEDGTLLASGSYDHTIRIWDIISGKCVNEVKNLKTAATNLGFWQGKLVAADWLGECFIVDSPYCYVFPRLEVKKSSGEIVSLPRGTVCRLKGNEIIFPLRGKVVSGKRQSLYPTSCPLLVFGPTSLTPYPDANFEITQIPAGTIIDSQDGRDLPRVLLTEDKKIAYINYKGLRGFVSTRSLARLEKQGFLLALEDKGENLRTYPGGEFAANLPLGASMKAVYYCPYLKSCFVRSDYGQGWIARSAVRKIDLEPVQGRFVAVQDAPVKLAWFAPQVIGYIGEGEDVLPEQKVKGENWFFVSANGIKGYVAADYLVKAVKSVSARMWNLMPDAPLYQAPSEKASIIGTVPQFEEVSSLFRSGDFYKVKIGSTGQTGWIKQQAITMTKPDLHKPYVTVLKKERRGNELTVRGIVADDTKIEAVYANGAPVIELSPLRSASNVKIPFQAEDIREFSYRVYVPENYPRFELLLTAQDRENKVGQARVKVQGKKIRVETEAVASASVMNPARKKAGVPGLALSVSLQDENSNNLFEGREKVKIIIAARNTGTCPASAVRLRINGGERLGLPGSIPLGTISEGRTIKKTLVYTLKDKIEGEARLSFYLSTPEGFESRQKLFSLKARNYEPPRLLVDYALKDANGDYKLSPEEIGTLHLVVQNVGGDASDLRLRITLPQGVYPVEGERVKVVKIKSLPRGEGKKITMKIAVPQRYAREHKDVPISVSVSGAEIEQNRTINLALNEYVQPPEEVAIKPRLKSGELRLASSDVDREVKQLARPSALRKDALALVIGVGNYRELPDSLFSDYDAILMSSLLQRRYAIKTVSLINEDATYLRIKDAVARLAADARGKNVYVYYSGHGFPRDEKPAFAPHDAPKSMPEDSLISLAWIADEFKKASPARVVIFTDACYSGYDREGRFMVAGARPGILKRKSLSLPRNFIYSAATDENGKSYSDSRIKHGIFTYFLAKGLLKGDLNQDGKIEAGELKRFFADAQNYARKLGFRDQRPVIKGDEREIVISEQ